MKDNRLKILAHTLLDHSLEIEKGDSFVVNAPYCAKPLVMEILNYANELEANAFINIVDEEINRLVLQNANEERFIINNKIESEKYKYMKGRINIRATENEAEMVGIDLATISLVAEIDKKLNNQIINEKNWALIEWPTKLGATKAKMSFEEYENFIFDVSTLNYQKMGRELKPLKDYMEKTDKVRIVGPNTDLTFSIKGQPAIICYGQRNIPDGEVYTSPIKNSINGKIQYNVKSFYQGKEFENITFTFKNGKIVKASSKYNTQELNKILDIDKGARYIGEFSLGLNPLITKPIGNILFDEKMAGSFHLTPGNCYKKADNKNHSKIHWDLVMNQMEVYGGGQIYFDDVLIRENGLFVIDELKHLNPKKLKEKL